MTIGADGQPIQQAPQPGTEVQNPQIPATKPYSVRLPIDITEALIQLHFALEHIPHQTSSDYLQYLVIQDAEKMRAEVKKRRDAVAR